MATATPETLRVDLPVCPVEDCRRVGKIPLDAFSGKESCIGRRGVRHKKTKMVPGTFELVEDGS